MTVKLGDRAIYRPRVPYGRQSELFCFITRVIDADNDIVDLVAFPSGGEVQRVNNVAPKSETAMLHCWEPHDETKRLMDEIDGLKHRLAALEEKRGPGRPPNADRARDQAEKVA